MKNIHILSTSKPSVLILRQDGKLFFTGYGGQLGKEHGLIKDTPQNIYITSDEEIKEGDWMIRGNEQPTLVTPNFFWDFGVRYYKIILTTDQDLIKNGVQAIDDEFLEFIVKNPSCEFVEVKHKDIIQYGNMTMHDYNGDGSHYFCKNCEVETSKSKEELLKFGVEYYKIIIPSDEAKQRAKNYMRLKDGYVEPKQETQYLDEMPNVDKKLLAKMWEDTIPKVDPKREVFLMNAHGVIDTREPKQEIVGYRLKPSIDRMMVDGILKNAMPIWNDEDKSVYFIRGHVGGSLVAKMKELQVLDLWFTPIYEDEEIKSDWVKEHHLEYYYKEGIIKNKETLEEFAERIAKAFDIDNYKPIMELIIDGAKWQQERMYSEEEVESIWKFALYSAEQHDKFGTENKSYFIRKDVEEFIEQFKKK